MLKDTKTTRVENKHKIMEKPSVISTFSGCGGSSLGYQMADFNELLAIDFDPIAVNSFRANFVNVPIWNQDITTVTSESIVEFTSIQQYELDVLDGSPPCQGFSTAGKRNVNDSRNDLFLSFVYLIEKLKPKVFLMENVPGMVKGTMKGLFLDILTTLKSTGYLVKAKLMNSQYYEVPQARQRIIFIGVHPALDIEPSFPEPISTMVSVKDVLGTTKIDNELASTKIINMDLKKYAAMTKQGEGINKYHPKGNFFNTRRCYWNQPSQTVTKTRNLLHPHEDRYLSIPEVKRLCSFPDDFQLKGTYLQQWGQLGNAVMPRFMYHLALHIRKEILKNE